jgi:hypothetical protein
MRVVATTVVRESVRGKQRTGYIYDVDWDAGRIRRRLPVPEPRFPESDTNPRGGVRGGRGVAATRAGIVVANYDTLHLYDDDWQVVDSFSHPLFVGIHEIDWDGKHVWLAATGLDAVLKATLDGSVEVAWDAHAEGSLNGYELRPRRNAIDGSVDYRRREAPLLNQCHVNGVVRWGDGLVVNCGLVRRTKPFATKLAARVRGRLGFPDKKKGHAGSRSLVVHVDSAGYSTVLLELEEHDFPSHNGQLLAEDLLTVNDSTNNKLRIFELANETARERRAVEVDGTWLRGLEPTRNGCVLLGSAPATLMLADLETGAIRGKIELSNDSNEAVHGLAIVPELHDRL